MTSTQSVDPEHSASTAEVTTSILAESVSIDKKTVVSGLAQVKVTVTERDETVRARLKQQHLSVDRVPIGVFVTETPQITQKGNVTTIPVFEERLITEKRLFLIEELRVTINQTEKETLHTVRLRREHAEVSHEPTD